MQQSKEQDKTPPKKRVQKFIRPSGYETRLVP
jgi:hypothetical protein